MYRVEKPNNPSSNKYINFYRIPMTQWATEGEFKNYYFIKMLHTIAIIN